MKPQELRIGNYIQWNDESQDIVQVIGVYIDDYCWWVQWDEDKSALLDEYKPIPLTPEILTEWCGFEAGEYGNFIGTLSENQYIQICDDYTIAIYKGSKDYMQCAHYIDLIGIKIEYLHQLQNLFYALTGEELNPTVK